MTVAAPENAAIRDRATNMALEQQMQLMKRQKTEDDFALLTATQNASSLETALEI